MADRDPSRQRPALHRVVGTFRLLAHYIRFNLSAGMAYRASFVAQVFGMVLNNSAFIVFWVILYERVGGDIKGYSIRDVMFLWALAASGIGLAGALLGNAGSISRLIYSGELDVYLLQPKAILPNLLASRMSISSWGDVLYGVLLFAFTQRVTLPSVLLFVTFSLLMALGFAAVQVLYHSLTFLWGNAEELAGTASELVLSFTIYPGSIFEGPPRWLLHSLLPAGLLAYVPARLFAHFEPWVFLLLLAADSALVAISVAAFRLGLRRYESGSTLVATRQ
jgi:ABC-2 type transport system permease protein